MLHVTASTDFTSTARLGAHASPQEKKKKEIWTDAIEGQLGPVWEGSLASKQKNTVAALFIGAAPAHHLLLFH